MFWPQLWILALSTVGIAAMRPPAATIVDALRVGKISTKGYPPCEKLGNYKKPGQKKRLENPHFTRVTYLGVFQDPVGGTRPMTCQGIPHPFQQPACLYTRLTVQSFHSRPNATEPPKTLTSSLKLTPQTQRT